MKRTVMVVRVGGLSDASIGAERSAGPAEGGGEME